MKLNTPARLAFDFVTNGYNMNIEKTQNRTSVTELISATASDIEAMDALMHELSSSSYCSEEKLKAALEDRGSHVYVIKDDGKIVATASLCVFHTPEFTLGSVEAVVVSERHRGKGYGKALVEHIINESRRFGCDKLHLTSNLRREAANRLYQELGFRKYETNYYCCQIKPF